MKEVMSNGTEYEIVARNSPCSQCSKETMDKKWVTLALSRTCFYVLLFCIVGV